MDNKIILGEIFIAVGEQLKDTTSKLYNSVVLSNEQMGAVLKLLKIASSPQTHYTYIGGLAMRYGKTDKTIRNWIRDGVIPKGRKSDSGDNRDYWLSHELFKIDEELIRKGFVKRKDITPIDKRLKQLLQNFS